eukprot:910140-Prorocentrum_lima.AAC.1
MLTAAYFVIALDELEGRSLSDHLSPELVWKPYVDITEEYAVVPEGVWSFPLKAEFEAQAR